jgi:hypothetical protein
MIANERSFDVHVTMLTHQDFFSNIAFALLPAFLKYALCNRGKTKHICHIIYSFGFTYANPCMAWFRVKILDGTLCKSAHPKS